MNLAILLLAAGLCRGEQRVQTPDGGALRKTERSGVVVTVLDQPNAAYEQRRQAQAAATPQQWVIFKRLTLASGRVIEHGHQLVPGLTVAERQELESQGFVVQATR